MVVTLGKRTAKIIAGVVAGAAAVAGIIAILQLVQSIAASSSQDAAQATLVAVLQEQLKVQREIATLQAGSVGRGPTATAVARRAAELEITAVALSTLQARLEVTLASPPTTPKPTDTPQPTLTSVQPSPTSSPIATPTPTPTATATQRTVLSSFFDDFESVRYWTEYSDNDGSAKYGDGGYVILAKPTKDTWGDVLPKLVFIEGSIEVDAVPLTLSEDTGFGISVGWQRGNTAFTFLVAPSGRCGFVRPINGVAEGANIMLEQKCKPVVQGKVSHVRLEVKNKNIRAFVDNNLVSEHTFQDYTPGLIDLEALNNYRQTGKQTEVKVKFDNLKMSGSMIR